MSESAGRVIHSIWALQDISFLSRGFLSQLVVGYIPEQGRHFACQKMLDSFKSIACSSYEIRAEAVGTSSHEIHLMFVKKADELRRILSVVAAFAQYAWIR